ncbi:MAG TPA: S41 family peptidase, partial [bacterium]|nr:S41 family peptidase [bacterium]
AQVVSRIDVPARLAALPGGNLVIPKGAGTASTDLRNLETVLTFLNQEALHPVEDQKKLIDGAIVGSVAALGDQYSRYIPRQESNALTEDISGIYGGIGVLIEQKDGHTIAATVFRDSPADKAGMQVADVILKVDGEDVTQAYVTDIVSKIKGKVDTNVVLTVYRPTTEETLDLTITRKDIKYPSVFEEKILDDTDKVGYIKLIVFNDKSGQDFADAIGRLKAQGIKSLVVDLRQNTGGTFKDSMQIADILVPSGALVYTEDRKGRQRPYESQDNGQALGLPLVVLTDGFSASASEIVAGAVQDTRSGVLVGDKTFGKGVVQSVIPLQDGSNLILTTAKYLTPNKRDINTHGIRPDVEVDFEAATKEDPFIAARITELEQLAARNTEIRKELTDYFADKDYPLQEALDLLADLSRYQEIVSKPGPTPADDQQAWEEEKRAEAEKDPAVPQVNPDLDPIEGNDDQSNRMNGPIDRQKPE